LNPEYCKMAEKVFPAYAGVFPEHTYQQGLERRVPRIRGGVPVC